MGELNEDTWGSWGLLWVSGWPLRGYCGFLVATGSYLGLLWTIGVLLWTTVDYWGDSWGHLGLLVTPGCFWLATKRLLWIPGDYWVLLGTTVDYWVLLWTTVDYWGDSWGHLGLLGTPGCFWLAPKRLLWTTGVTPGDTWGSWGLLGVPGWPLRGYCGIPR